MKWFSKWRKVRPLAALILALTGVGAPITAVILTGGDVVTTVADDIQAEKAAEQEQGAANE